VGCEILVDGYNVIKRNPQFQILETKSLEAARGALITLLVNRYSRTAHRVTVVFDGQGVREQKSHDRGICIIFSPAGQSADSIIARLSSELRREGKEVVMYSDDDEVKQVVTQQGGSAKTTGQLTRQLNAAPSDVARRARHRIAATKKYGLNPNYDPYADEPENEYPAKKGKKKSSRRKK
jgi:uncharacterized protein